MKRMPNTASRRETGLALLALVFIMLILGMVGYTFISIISSHRISISDTGRSIKTFYIREGALEIGQQFVADYWATHTVPLGPDILVFSNEPLGDGTFSLWVTMTDIMEADFEVSAIVAE